MKRLVECSFAPNGWSGALTLKQPLTGVPGRVVESVPHAHSRFTSFLGFGACIRRWPVFVFTDFNKASTRGRFYSKESLEKMSIHRKLTTVCCAAVLALGLAACGSDDDKMVMEMNGDGMEPAADEQLATLRGEIAELRKQLGIEDDDDLGDSISDLQDEIADLKGQVEDQEDAAAAAAAKAHTAKLNKLAMGIEAPSTDDATLTDHVQTDTDKPGTATDGDAPHAISGWSGSSYSFSTTMAVVYSNKEAATPTAFSKEYGTTFDADADGVYTFDTGANGKLVEMAGLPTNANHPGVLVGPAQFGGVKGTFNGVPGTFSSDPTVVNLTVEATVMGEATWTGNLNFKPDSATANVMRADDNYMNLGWWLNETDGALDPTVAAWPKGDPYDAGTKMVPLKGKATFMGIAVGKYTHKTINSIEGGHYNASAKLVADFDDADDPGTLAGTIDGFMQDGQPIGSGWKVELGVASDPKTGAGISNGAVVDQNNGALGTFGTQKTAGTWNAMFHDNDRRDGMPGGVGGTFHVGETGHPINMIGAFAASNQEADQPAN